MFTLFGMSSAAILGKFLGFVLCAAFTVSIFGLLLSIIAMVVKTAITPVIIMAELVENAAKRKQNNMSVDKSYRYKESNPFTQ